MKLLPRSLFSRLVLVLFAGLLVAQLAGFALHMQERAELLAQASGTQSAQRIADMVGLIDPMSPGERETILKVLNAPPLMLNLEQPPLAAQAMDTEASVRAARLMTILRRLLGAEREIAVQVTRIDAVPRKSRAKEGKERKEGKENKESKGSGNPRNVRGKDETPRSRESMERRAGARGLSFVAQIKLRDGVLATFDTNVSPDAGNWPYRLLLSILLLLVAVLLVSWVAVRWATRPLKALADAADELGANINRAPMPESGPVEVVRAARAFNTMQSRLAAHMRERTQVMAAMSHDLKTPITRLRLRAELLDDERLRAKFAGDLQEMESMVTAALDFLRGMDNGEPVQPVDIMAILESLQADIQETGGSVKIEGQASEPYRGRAQALKRCIRNLVENAIKYGQRARIVVEDSPQRLVLHIQDEGPGIPAAELAKVFEPFYRVEASRNRDTGGTGLGLPIARGIAELHGGSVTLVNQVGGGLEATLILPRA